MIVHYRIMSWLTTVARREKREKKVNFRLELRVERSKKKLQKIALRNTLRRVCALTLHCLV